MVVDSRVNTSNNVHFLAELDETRSDHLSGLLQQCWNRAKQGESGI